jgi:hypothetical protein
MWNWIKRWWATEGAMVELQGVTDRMLADMGLQREGLRDRVMSLPPEESCRCAPQVGWSAAKAGQTAR